MSLKKEGSSGQDHDKGDGKGQLLATDARSDNPASAAEGHAASLTHGVTALVGDGERAERQGTALLGVAAAKRILEQRKDAQDKRKREAEAKEKEKGLRWTTLTSATKEAIVYFIFLCIFCAATFGPRSPFAYHLHATVDKLLYQPTWAYRQSFYTIGSKDDIYNWMTAVFLPNWLPTFTPINATYWENTQNYTGTSSSAEVSNSTTFMLSDQVNLRVGLARVRTQRAADRADCFVPSVFEGLISNCYGDLQGGRNKSLHYGVPFRTQDDLSMPDFKSLITRLTYDGDGYAADLPNDYARAQAMIDSVFINETFIDDSTRAVLLDFSVYSPFVDYFSVQTVLIELLPSNLAVVSATDRVAPLLRPLRVFSGEATTYQTAMMSMELILYGMVLMYIMREIQQWRELGTTKYFDSGWNCIEVMNFGCFFVTIVLRMAVIGETYRIQDKLTDREHFNDLVSIATLSVQVDSVNSINAVLCFLKFFKYLNVNKKLAQFNDTIVLAYKDMLVLCVIIMVVLGGFALAFVLCLGSVLYNYRSLTAALLTLFQAILGTFDLVEIRKTSPVVGTLLFMAFVFFMMFIIMSMFLATVDKSYEFVRNEILTNPDTNNDEFSYDLMRIRKAFFRQVDKVAAFLGDDDDDDDGSGGVKKANSKGVEGGDSPEGGEGQEEGEEGTEKSEGGGGMGAGNDASNSGGGQEDPALQSMGAAGYHEIRSRIYRLEMSHLELRQILQAAEKGLAPVIAGGSDEVGASGGAVADVRSGGGGDDGDGVVSMTVLPGMGDVTAPSTPVAATGAVGLGGGGGGGVGRPLFTAYD